MLLQEWDVLLKQLFLKRFGGGGNNHAAAAADRGNQVGECLSGSRARFDDDVLVLLKSFVDDPRHFQLRGPQLISRMALFEDAA